MNKCVGCGTLLQKENPLAEGFVKNDSNICERCFRIRNYSDCKIILKSNTDFKPILQKIGATNKLVVLVVDLFMLNKDFTTITKYLNNNILLVLTKRDILPKSINNKKFVDYLNYLNIDNIIDSVIISSKKNYGFDELFEKINKYKNGNKVYIVGFTNAGKSTMINKLLYNYSDLKDEITTSILPSTTLNSIEIKLNDNLTLIDTPGLIDNDNLLNSADYKTLKMILPNKEIKPITYQIKSKQTIYIDDIARVDLNNKNNLTFYLSNSLNLVRTFKASNKLRNLKEHIIRVKQNQDIVINGLGFIKVTNNDVIRIYIRDGVDIYVRKSLI